MNRRYCYNLKTLISTVVRVYVHGPGGGGYDRDVLGRCAQHQGHVLDVQLGCQSSHNHRPGAERHQNNDKSCNKLLMSSLY